MVPQYSQISVISLVHCHLLECGSQSVKQLDYELKISICYS